MEYYAELLAKGSTDRLPEVVKRLKECPPCEVQNREELGHLTASQSETRKASPSGLTEPMGTEVR